MAEFFSGMPADAARDASIVGPKRKGIQSGRATLSTNRDSRRRLAISAGAWALLVGCLSALVMRLLGQDAVEVTETAALGGIGAAICTIIFYPGDIIALANRLTEQTTMV